MTSEEKGGAIFITMIAFVVIVIFVFVLWGAPQYKIYRLEKNGLALLKEAEWSKQVLIEEARAQKESASLYAEAEIERARGVAEANRIIGTGLKGNEEYLKYLYIQGLSGNDNQIIYVPTEATIPIKRWFVFLHIIGILEAGKRQQ